MEEKINLLVDLLEKRFITSKLNESTVGFTYLSGTVNFECKFEIDLYSKGIYLSAIAPLPLESDNFLVTLDWINSVNEKLFTGHFVIDSASDKIRFNTGSYFWKEELTQRKMRTLLESMILTIDTYTRSLVALYVGKANENFEKVIALIGEDVGIGVSKSCHYKYEKHPKIERN